MLTRLNWKRQPFSRNLETDIRDTCVPADKATMLAVLVRRVQRNVVQRDGMHRLLEQLRKNDVLVVWKLDRLSRSLKDVLTLMERIAQAKAGFRSLTEAIDTTSPGGR